jgi:hypothetical protein
VGILSCSDDSNDDDSNRNDHHHIKRSLEILPSTSQNISFEERLDYIHSISCMVKNTNLAYLGDDSINYCQDDYD